MGTLSGASLRRTPRIVCRISACTVALLAVLLSPVIHQGASDAAPSVKWRATQAPLPAGAETSQTSYLDGIACSETGSCVATGAYTDSDGQSTALLEVLTDGSWTPASLTLPPNAAPGGTSFLGPVSCPALGSCVAVGAFTDTGGNTQGLIESLSNGNWTPAELGLPANAGTNPEVDIDDLACPSNKHCYVVGRYETSQAGYYDPFIVKVSDGRSNLQQFPAPGSEVPNTFYVSSISCPSARSCFAFGGYMAALGDSLTLVETLADGTWTSEVAPVPSGVTGEEDVQLGPVRCGGMGSCSAPGFWSPSNGGTVDYMFETLSGETWEGSEAPLPNNAASTQPGIFPFDHISCPASGSCMGAELYTTSSNARGWFADTLSGNSWTSTELPLPSGAEAEAVVGVACGGPGSCNVLAAYGTSGGQTPFLAETLSGGAWTATPLPLPAGGGFSTSSIIVGDTCPSTTRCIAVGADQAQGQTSAHSAALIETMLG